MKVLVIIGTIIVIVILFIMVLNIASSNMWGIYKFLLTIAIICLGIYISYCTYHYAEKVDFEHKLSLYQITENDFKPITKVDFHDLDDLHQLGFKNYKIYKRINYLNNTYLIYKDTNTSEYKGFKLSDNLLTIYTEDNDLRKYVFNLTTSYNILEKNNHYYINNKVGFNSISKSNLNKLFNHMQVQRDTSFSSNISSLNKVVNKNKLKEILKTKKEKVFDSATFKFTDLDDYKTDYGIESGN